MSTRSCIVRKTGEGKFKGRYHHWDGYPTGLGRTLFKLYRGHFKKDLPAMLKYLIDDHPAGWSTINGYDFTQPPGYDGEGGFTTEGPRCYCHGGRKEEGWLVTEKNASGSGCEYAYMFVDPSQQGNADAPRTMSILSSFYADDAKQFAGQKMIGMFGSGGKPKDGVYWKVIAVVNLDGKEPNWEKIESAEQSA